MERGREREPPSRDGLGGRRWCIGESGMEPGRLAGKKSGPKNAERAPRREPPRWFMGPRRGPRTRRTRPVLPTPSRWPRLAGGPRRGGRRSTRAPATNRETPTLRAAKNAPGNGAGGGGGKGPKEDWSAAEPAHRPKTKRPKNAVARRVSPRHCKGTIPGVPPKFSVSHPPENLAIEPSTPGGPLSFPGGRPVGSAPGRIREHDCAPTWLRRPKRGLSPRSASDARHRKPRRRHRERAAEPPPLQAKLATGGPDATAGAVRTRPRDPCSQLALQASPRPRVVFRPPRTLR